MALVSESSFTCSSVNSQPLAPMLRSTSEYCGCRQTYGVRPTGWLRAPAFAFPASRLDRLPKAEQDVADKQRDKEPSRDGESGPASAAGT